MSADTDTTGDLELAERILPLVNDILERFNQENITPPEGGMVILALITRLLEALEEHPEARRQFIIHLIEVVNSHLLQDVGEAPQGGCPGGTDGPE